MKQILKWLVPVFFVLLAIFFYTAIPGYSFSGLMCLGIAGIITCYYLLDLLAKHHLMTAKKLRTVLSTVLIVGILIVGVTEILIIQAAQGDEDSPCQYMVVLGAGVRGTTPSLILSDRIDRAYTYLTEHPDVICIVSGGQGPNEAISEAQCIFDHLTGRGIDPERIWLEDQSTSTWENFRFTLDLIQEKTGTRPEKLGVISSEFHLFRAGLFAKDCGVEAVGIPASTRWLSLKINYFLREAAGVWHYLILGGQYHD